MIFQLKYKLRNLIVLTLIALLFCPPALVQAATLEGNVKKSFILSDHLGSTISVINESGTEESYTEYKPFGSVQQESGSTTLKKKFTGKELDESTGLYDYEARQYDAEIGRFITADPLMWDDASLKQVDGKGLKEFLSNPQNLNRYSYTLNNPLKYVDSSGKKVELAEKWVKFFGFNVGVHRFLLLTPDNPADFAHMDRFVLNSQGERVSTVSGQPKKGILTSQPNSDLDSTIIARSTINPPDGISDTQFIQNTLRVEGSYKNNLKYEVEPKKNSKGYNSNSFARGVLGAGGINSPPKLSSRYAPGFNKPVPLGLVNKGGAGRQNVVARGYVKRKR